MRRWAGRAPLGDPETWRQRGPERESILSLNRAYLALMAGRAGVTLDNPDGTIREIGGEMWLCVEGTAGEPVPAND